jgi:hypothetical protein
MTLKRRSLVMMGLMALAAAAYGTARASAPALVLHVVEQSLNQKAPADVGPETIRRRLDKALSATPDGNARMRLLLRISRDLEKIQQLTHEEWEMLWREAGPGDPPGIRH